MSAALVALDRKTGEPVLDSRVAARELGVEHESIIKLLGEYSEESSDLKSDLLGVVRFETEKRPGSRTGQKERYALLSERQALLLITMVRNSPEALRAKERLVDAFLAMRAALLSRKIDKVVRRELTDALRDSGEAERTHGHAYSLYTDLVYRAVLGMDAKHYREAIGLGKDEPVRAHLTAAQDETVRKFEDMVRTMVELAVPFDQIKTTITTMAARSLPCAKPIDAAEDRLVIGPLSPAAGAAL